MHSAVSGGHRFFPSGAQGKTPSRDHTLVHAFSGCQGSPHPPLFLFSGVDGLSFYPVLIFSVRRRADTSAIARRDVTWLGAAFLMSRSCGDSHVPSL